MVVRSPCYPHHLVVRSPSYPHQKVVLIKPTLNQIKSTCHHYLLGGRLLSKLPVQHFQMNGLFSDSKFPQFLLKRKSCTIVCLQETLPRRFYFLNKRKISQICRKVLDSHKSCNIQNVPVKTLHKLYNIYSVY